VAEADPAASPRRWRPSRASLAALVITLIVTGFLSWLCYDVNDRNEDRLLHLQTQQTGSVLQAIVPSIETPLASAAEIAATGHGDPSSFKNYISGYLAPNGTFVSASLWQLGAGGPRLIAVVGKTPELNAQPGKVAAFLARASSHTELSITGPIGTSNLRLGWAFVSTDKTPAYAVYAETALPANRRAASPSRSSPFADLIFALYLGRSATPGTLLESNVTPPLSGRTATVVVPFGANSLTLVASNTTQLGGKLSGWLWWIVAVLGVLIAIVAALTTERLVRRRQAAERLASEVQTLLGEQRTIAETLQHALLPKDLPRVAGVEFAVRYLPGVNGVDIGGDWYDVIPVDNQRCIFVVGDVSGRGVGAGAVMASLNFAIRGFVSEGHPPATILDKLAPLLSVAHDKHFATVLCGLADIERHEITVANAGHPPPLIVSANGAEYVNLPVGPPIGVANGHGHQAVTVTVPPRATLIAYTDGLIERRGEDLDTGLSRLRTTAASASGSLDSVIDTVLAGLAHDGHDDDTAILGVRWLA
jgi:serine phosphatase RsbU (regulator of sigma subunit)